VSIPEPFHMEVLGLCEHCNELLNLSNMPLDAIDAKWACPNSDCGREITHLSFGYDSGGKNAKKVKWVGPKGQWVNEKPLSGFELQGIFVI